MSDKLTGAIEELQAHLDLQLQDVADTKKMINSLRKRMGLDPLYTDVAVEQGGAIRPDQFYGKPLATAAQEYLERRKQACTGEEIMAGLLQGGFDFDALGWKEKTRMRNVTISLAKNTQKFHKLPNNTFGLLAWYDPNVISAKRERAKQGGSGSEPEEDAVVADEASA